MTTNHHKTPPGVMSLEQIEANMDYAEPLFRAGDPYEQAHGYKTAAQAFGALAAHQSDPTLNKACHMASFAYEVLAARVRFASGIPTIMPRTEAELLALDRCDGCGRPYSIFGDGTGYPRWPQRVDLTADPDEVSDGRCPLCPRLLFGPTPTSRADAEQYPTPAVVDSSTWHQDPDD